MRFNVRGGLIDTIVMFTAIGALMALRGQLIFQVALEAPQAMIIAFVYFFLVFATKPNQFHIK